MALIMTEGFDAYGSVDGGTMVPSQVTSRRGWNSSAADRSRTGRIDGFAFSGSGKFRKQKKLLSTTTSKVVGTAIKIVSNNAKNNTWVFELREGSTTQVSVWLNASSQLEVRRGTSTILDTGTTVLSNNVWYYIEFQTTIDNAGSYELRIDGAVEVSGSADTQDTSNTYWNSVGYGSNSFGAHYIYWDDMYVTDTSGSDNTGFLGLIHIETIFPDADVTAGWTGSGTHALLMDDNPADDDATYVSSKTSLQRELQDFPPLGSEGLDIFGVTHVIDARVTESTPVDINFVNVSNATTTVGANLQIASVSQERFEKIYEQDPDAAAAWDRVTLEAAQFGFEIT